MSDISNQLIKNSYDYVLQSDLVTGVVYRIGGAVPVNPIFLSGLTINSGFTFSNGTEQNGYVLTCDPFGNANWAPVSGTTSSGDYLPLSGGTVTGGTIFQSGLTANTISATTYYNLPTDVFVTGGTYSNGTLYLTNNTGHTFNIPGFSTATGNTNNYYGSFSDTTTQVVNGANTPTAWSANTTELSNGIYIVDGSKITVSNDGIYEIGYSAQIEKTQGVGANVTIWAKINGNNVTRSSSTISLVNNSIYSLPFVSYIFDLYAGDQVEFYFSSPSEHIQITTLSGLTTPTRPVSPSLIIVAKAIGNAVLSNSGDSYVTGFTLTNDNLTLSQNRVGQYSGFTVNLPYLNISGGTITGNLSVTGSTSSGTISATTYQNLPSSFQSVSISGTTQFSANTGTFINFSGVNVSITSASTNTLVFSGSPQFTVPGSNNQVLTSDGSGGAVAESLLTFDGAAASPTLDVNGVKVGRGFSNLLSNISIGSTIAFPAGSTGCYNVSLGSSVLGSNTSGSYNIGIGKSSLKSNTIGDSNVAIGSLSLSNNNTGCLNVAIGKFSLCSNNDGYSNIGVGQSSLRCLTTGAGNIAIGINTLGSSCGYANFSNNIALGSKSQGGRNSGDNNISMGTNSQLYSISTNRNISIGTQSLFCNQGSDNVALGYKTLCNNTSGSKNIAIGSFSLIANASCGNSGNGNIAIGYDSLRINVSTSDSNIAIGQAALYYNTNLAANVNKPDFNIAIGRCTMLNNNDGCENIAIGRRALMSNAGAYSNRGCANVALGRGTMANNYTGNYNIALGRSSLYSNTTGYHNIALGRNSGGEITTGYQNISLGYNSLYSTTTGVENISIGTESLYNNTKGSRNIAIGRRALSKVDSKNDNIAIGSYTMFNFGTSAYKQPNIAIGFKSLYGSPYASFAGNTAIGYRSQHQNQCGLYNVSLGNNTLYYNTCGSLNVAIGAWALYANTAGHKNIALGYKAMYNNTTGYRNIAIGYCVESGNYNNSIILGGYATATANSQFVVGSSTIPIGTITTETCTSSKTWEISINGNTYKVLLA